jgi:hypothetical protein
MVQAAVAIRLRFRKMRMASGLGVLGYLPGSRHRLWIMGHGLLTGCFVSQRCKRHEVGCQQGYELPVFPGSGVHIIPATHSLLVFFWVAE